MKISYSLHRKYLLILFFIWLSNNVFAQGFFYGVQAGFSGSTIIEKGFNSEQIEKSLKYGMHAGIAAEFELLDFLAIGSSISFLQKGDRIKDEYANSSISIGYIDIPIFLMYKMPIGNFKIAGTVGPYTSIAVAGNRKAEIIEDVEPYFEWHFEEHGHDSYFDNSTPVFGDDWNSYKRIDSGLSIGLKFEYKNYQFSTVYSRGFIDIRSDEAFVANNSSLYVSLTYFFNKYRN